LVRDNSAGTISVGALLYQAESLAQKLSTFTTDSYPPQTVSIARLLKLLADRAYEQLAALESVSVLPVGEQARAMDLGNIVQCLHSYLRYLHASAPLETPPGVQQSITALISTHATAVLGCLASEINVLVRPQWRYSLKYVDILHQFESEADCVLWYALDRTRELEADGVRELVEALWKRSSFQKAGSVPKHIAVLSFPGLDRDDVLLYPLLAHELGHFLDFACEDNQSEATASILESTLPAPREVFAVVLTADDYKRLADTAAICLRELTADLLAARMAGLGYYFAFNEYFKTLDEWPGEGYINSRSGYPTFGLRLKLVWEELTAAAGGTGAIETLLGRLQHWPLDGLPHLTGYLDTSGARAREVELPVEKSVEGTVEQKLEILANNTLSRSIPLIRELARQIIPDSRVAKVPADLDQMVELLEARIPPFQAATRSARKAAGYSAWSFHEFLTAGWIYQLSIGDEREGALEQKRRAIEYRNTCFLLLKAIELQDARETIAAIMTLSGRTDESEKPDTPIPSALHGGVLSGPSIRAALDASDSATRLSICPDFGDGPIEAASRDVHLGHWFRVFKRTSLDRIDLADPASTAKARLSGQGEVFVKGSEEFVLQPGDFVLAISLEYVSLPPGLMAFVEGKSSLGRAGLLVATATQVAPGFKGCIVLELFNAGTVPVILRPAMRVAQLVLVTTNIDVDERWLYSGRFQVQIRP